jgi:hypothetical protein
MRRSKQSASAERNERLNGEPALLVECPGQRLVRIAVLGAGMLGELATLLAALAT